MHYISGLGTGRETSGPMVVLSALDTQENGSSLGHGSKKMETVISSDSESDDDASSRHHFEFQHNEAYGVELESAEHRGYENILEDI